MFITWLLLTFITYLVKPLARTITLHKDASGLLGFSYKDNLITAVMQDSSASRNGLLINQRIIEIDGRNFGSIINEKTESNCATVMTSSKISDIICMRELYKFRLSLLV
ncbi:hypothetical protein X798_04708 [Onchocerca flexuosa]|uniref:PDZ domain-containing protein n=1 Tax=Onchocerca flexuosa TaxID=387005 RepID=A0A238BS59_9BILA|nr:hypothetical protein X798_04708 [Onchocerca flexuosa]